jgi:hypothetical protein
MGSNRNIWSVIVTVALCLVAVWFSTSWGQGRANYQTETRVYSTPDYQTDTTRAINAYEKLMDRYMDTTERNFSALSTDIKMLTVKLDAMDAKLASLDTRLARIEQRLGIVTVAPAAAEPNAPAPLPQKAKPQPILNPAGKMN